MSHEMGRYQRLAERLWQVAPVEPSEAVRIRAWNLASAGLTRQVAVPSRRRPFRLTLALVAAVAMVLVGTAAAAAQSLPDSPLYPIKRFDESLRLALTVGTAARFSYHLELAQTRLDEAEAMLDRGRLDLADASLVAYDLDLAEAGVEAGQAGSPAEQSLLEARLQQAIAVHDAQLAGLQGHILNPTARAAIQAARDRAASNTPPGQGKPGPQTSHAPKNSP